MTEENLGFTEPKLMTIEHLKSVSDDDNIPARVSEYDSEPYKELNIDKI